MSGLDEDLQDLEVVVDYLVRNYGYVIDLIVGHSRGSLVSMRWLCTSEHAKGARGFVNVSGRYRMEVKYFTPSASHKFSCPILVSAYMARFSIHMAFLD